MLRMTESTYLPKEVIDSKCFTCKNEKGNFEKPVKEN